jgi:hypothetical protein
VIQLERTGDHKIFLEESLEKDKNLIQLSPRYICRVYRVVMPGHRSATNKHPSVMSGLQKSTHILKPISSTCCENLFC